jgi:hypothetical protein
MSNTAIKSERKKPKLVRDSFTIPKTEYGAIDALKTRAIALGSSVKKSELLRAGLLALQAMTDAQFKLAVAAVPQLKTGRPAAQTAPDIGKAAQAPAPAPAALKTPAPAVKPKVAAKAPAKKSTAKTAASPSKPAAAATRQPAVAPAAPRRPKSAS